MVLCTSDAHFDQAATYNFLHKKIFSKPQDLQKFSQGSKNGSYQTLLFIKYKYLLFDTYLVEYKILQVFRR